MLLGLDFCFFFFLFGFLLVLKEIFTGSVVDAGDQVMCFAVAKVPLERVLRWRTQRREGERKEKEARGRREKKIITAFLFLFFFFKFRTKLSFSTKLVGFKMF